MFDTRTCGTTLNRLMLAGALAVSVVGASTAARAVPVASIGPAASQTQMVQYGYGYRRHGYRGRAGLYDCAPGHVNSHLARKACGGAKFPRRF